MISRILIASDGSKLSQKAATYAVELAQQVHASIVALSVVDKRIFMGQNVPGANAGMQAAESTADDLHEAAKGYLEDIKKLCEKGGVDVKSTVRMGYPVEEIVKEARKSEADLIIMGSRGMNALSASALGSVSYGVVNYDSHLPVLIVRG